MARSTSLLKQASKSRMMWFAVILEVLGVVQVNADFLSTVLTPAQFGWLMLGIGVAIKILRLPTTTSIGEK